MATPESDPPVFQSKIRDDVAPPIKLGSRTIVCRSSSSSAVLTDSFANSNILLEVEEPYISPNERFDISLRDLPNSEAIKSDTTTGESEHFVSEWLAANFPIINEYTIQKETQNVEIFKYMANFITSTYIKPDILLVHGSIPLFLCEIQSGKSFYSDILKSVVSLIYQLRSLRNYDDTINHVCGFVFPSLKTKQTVTMVKVEWGNLVFTAKYTYLKRSNVKRYISDVLEDQCMKFADLAKGEIKGSFFMVLSSSELSWLKEELKSGPLEQVQSKFSILVKDECYYYKLVPLLLHRDNLRDLLLMKSKTKADGFHHLVFPIDLLKVNDQVFFKFESQLHVLLNPENTLKHLNLVEFVSQMKNALEELHNLGYAHNDIRLPNICLSTDRKLKLIDFDRAMAAKSKYAARNNNHFFHEAPKRTAASLDYKQLGLLILQLKNKPDHQMEFKTKLFEKDFANELFLSRLIFHGEFDDTLFDEWSKEFRRSTQ